MTSLPLRGLPVDLDELVVAFEAEDTELQWFLDTQTGDVILLNLEYEPGQYRGLTADEIETDPSRFVRVPPSEVHHIADDMESFSAQVVDPQLKESLHIALSAPRPERRFKAALSWLPEQESGWHAWRQTQCKQRAISWLGRLGLAVEARAA